MKRNERAHTGVCLCCRADVPPERNADHPALPFCPRCVSGNCRKCRSWVRGMKWQRDPTFNFIGRPRGPQMPCGWGCGAKLTGIQMRAHFTICPNRPAISDGVRQPAALVAAGRELAVQNEPDEKPGGEAWTPAGTANAVRLALRSRADGQPDAHALHQMFETAEGSRVNSVGLMAKGCGIRLKPRRPKISVKNPFQNSEKTGSYRGGLGDLPARRPGTLDSARDPNCAIIPLRANC